MRLAVMRPGSSTPVLVGLTAGEGEEGSDISVLSFKFEDDEKKADTLALTIDNRDLKQLDGGLWTPGNRIAFQYGYPGHMSPIRQATITVLKGFKVLYVEADADEVKMGRIQRTDRTWENVRRSDVVREIAREYGFDEASIFVEDSIYPIESITQAGETDHQLLRRLALQEGFEFYIDHDGLHFKARDLDATPIRVITWFTDPGVGDIIGEPSLELDKRQPKPGKISAGGKDPNTGQPFLVTADSVSNADRTALAPTSAAIGPDDEEGIAFDPKTGAKITVHTPRQKSEAQASVSPSSERTQDQAQRNVDATYRQNALKGATLTIKLVGDPTLFAKKRVRLRGVGTSLSGNWYVKSATHVLDNDYTTTIKCGRDNLGGAEGTPTSNVNDRDPGNATFWGSVERSGDNGAFWRSVEQGGAGNRDFWRATEDQLEPVSIYDDLIDETRTIMVPKGTRPKPGRSK